MADELSNFASPDRQRLPPYTHIPGKTPHPISDARGHSYQQSHSHFSPSELISSAAFLFNSGYYWEAHELWEQAWNHAGRKGPEADLLKGLIKLAACGVKCLEGNESGAKRHALRAEALFQAASAEQFRQQGLEKQTLILKTQACSEHPPVQLATNENDLTCIQPILGTLDSTQLGEN